MSRPLPILATLLGVAGLLPFIGCGVAALGPQGERGALALVAYGAVILGFLGGVHWGFALTEPDRRGERERLVLGVAPALVGWVALLLALAVNGDAGVGLLLLAGLGMTAVEARAWRAGLMPSGYMTLRFGLSAGMAMVLALVLLLRAIGAQITPW